MIMYMKLFFVVVFVIIYVKLFFVVVFCLPEIVTLQYVFGKILCLI